LVVDKRAKQAFENSRAPTITDLLQVKTARTSAQKNYLNALFDYRLSYAALELATGRFAPDSPAVTN
jgi:outer membrane protein TolC